MEKSINLLNKIELKLKNHDLENNFSDEKNAIEFAINSLHKSLEKINKDIDRKINNTSKRNEINKLSNDEILKKFNNFMLYNFLENEWTHEKTNVFSNKKTEKTFISKFHVICNGKYILNFEKNGNGVNYLGYGEGSSIEESEINCMKDVLCYISNC